MERRRFLGFIAIGVGASFATPWDAARMVVPTGVEMTNRDLLRRLPSTAYGGLLTEAQSERFIDLIVNTSQLLPKARVVEYDPAFLAKVQARERIDLGGTR